MSIEEIREPLRMLLLPARPGAEASCAQALENALKSRGVASQEFLSWVSLELEEWRITRNASANLRSVAKAVILAGCGEFDSDVMKGISRLADRYFTLHRKLMEEHLMAHEEAISFLSHSFLLAHLSCVEKLSAAQISVLLSGRDQRTKFSRQSIASALGVMRVRPDLTVQQIITLYARDAAEEPLTLADADLITAAEIVSEVGRKLGYRGNLLEALKTLAPQVIGKIESPFTPYLQILHYQCLLADFFDHDVTDIYEFSPRGKKGEWLHKQYPHSIAGAKNPFLNNAKAVEALDVGWVRSRKTPGERKGARALHSILEGMQAMAFFARRELAWWIRIWLHRIIRIAGMVPITIPASLQPDQIRQLLSVVSAGNTGTYGILEQRVLDAVVSTLYPDWRSRGLGDSVNATNISRTKLGDCEFLDPKTRTVEAYESHGGELSLLYVREHLSTLRKYIRRRIDELSAIADPQCWNIKITFVAHTVASGIPSSATVEGLKINIGAIEFADIFQISNIDVRPELVQAIESYLLIPLQEQRTPNEVRQKFLSII